MYIRYVRDNFISRKEKESLYKLFEEEEIISKLTNKKIKNKHEEKLFRYAKSNKFRLSDIGSINTDNFKNMVDICNFVFLKDKNGIVMGYLAFKIYPICVEESNKNIIIVKHMYISNSQNHTFADYLLFFVAENMLDDSIIYSTVFYRPMSELNGYNMIGKKYQHENMKYLKIKEKTSYPLLFTNNLRYRLSMILEEIKNTSENIAKI